MNRSRLTSAVLILWSMYAAAAGVIFLFLPAGELAVMYQAMPSFMATFAPPEGIGLADMDAWQKLLLRAWTAPVLLAWLSAVMVGIVIAGLALMAVGERYRKRALGSDYWHAARGSIGPLLSPRLPHDANAIDVALEGVNLSKAQQAFVNDALGLIAARPDTFTGDGHGTGLYQHTLNVMERAVEHPRTDVLLVMAAAAHDIGKLVSYKQVGESWQKIREHSIETGRLVRLLPAFKRLDPKQAQVLFLAVRYEHEGDQMPLGTDPQVHDLRERLAAIDGEATADEKQEVLAARDPETELIELFDAQIGSMPFYRKGLARDVKTVGMRKGRYLYFNEIALRSWLTPRLDRDFAAALGGRIRHRGQVHAITQHLLKRLHARGHLVTKIQTDDSFINLPPEVALWTIKSGRMEFNGMFIIRVPEDSPIVMPEAAPFQIKAVRPATAGLSELATVEQKSDSDEIPAIEPATEDSQATETIPKTKAAPRASTGRKARPKRKARHQNETDAGKKPVLNATDDVPTVMTQDEPSATQVTGPWSAQEVATLEQHAAEPRARAIKMVAKRTHRSTSAVERKLRTRDNNHGETVTHAIQDPARLLEYKPVRRSGRWSDEEVALIEQHISKGHIACIELVARETGRSERSVERKVKKYADEAVPFGGVA